jgi:hypothetical protein
MQNATIYLREDSFYIGSNSQTVDGAWIANARLHRIATNDDRLLGEMTIDALAHSCTGVPHPTDFKALVAPLLTISQQSTWRRFASNTLALLIENFDCRIRLMPYRNLGGSQGFESISESEDEFSATNDYADLGRRIREAFERCE